jgi:hypothetical protein
MDKGAGDVTGAEILRQLRSRKDFLRMAGAAGIGAAVGSNVLLRAALSQDTLVSNPLPTDLTFSLNTQYRPFDLLAKNFMQLRDSFDSDTSGNYAVLAPAPERNRGNAFIKRGALRVNGDSFFALFRSTTSQSAPFATVIVDVERFSDTTGAENTVYAGLVKDEANYVTVFYNNATKKAGITVAVNGTLTTLGTVDASLAAPLKFAFAANENEVTALVGDRSSDIGNFRPLIKKDVSFETGGALDLRNVTVLESYKNGFGAQATAGAIVLGGVQAGYYGECGVRDPHCIQYADGTPYIKDNKLYFTLTNAGLGFFEKAHWAVWTMDLSDYTKIEQVGNVFWKNAGDPNKVLGHHAGQIVLDEAGGRWIVLVSSWGDFGPQGGDRALEPGVVTPNPANPPVDILYDELPSSTDLLRGVHILEGKRHPVNDVPFKTEGKWDPGLTLIGDRWYLPYVIALDLFTDFQPALARSASGADHTVLEFVGADWGKRATEGPILQKLGGNWRVLASCGDDEPLELHDKYPMYFLEATDPDAEAAERQLRFDDYLDAPHPTNIPHPMVVPIPLNTGNTKYSMITFNGTQYYESILGYGTHGDFIVMDGQPIQEGYEFPPRDP